MQKHEQKFIIKFRKWIKENPMSSCALEFKSTRGKSSFPFSELKEHQIYALQASKMSDGFLYKLSDESQGFKPYDCFYFRNAFAWVVIDYPEGFVIIDIDTFVNENKRSKVRSLTWQRARDISSLECLSRVA